MNSTAVAVVGAVKSKTMWFSMLLIILGLFDQNADLAQALVPSEYQGLFLAGVGLVTAFLRTQTTKALSEK